MTKFNVVINPFSHKILVSARVNKMSCEEVLQWNGDNDWWHSFEMNGSVFDFNLSYDEELSVTVYPAPEEGEQSLYNVYFKTTFKVIHKDEF